jgi:hypothetical protein
MLVRHTTLARSLASCIRRGLLCSRSQGRLRAVWVHSPHLTGGLVLHTCDRHKARPEATVTIELDVPRAWLRGHKKGLWYCTRDIPPERFRRVLSYSLVARSI